MAQLFARIELGGSLDRDAYLLLDRYMRSKFWEKTIIGTKPCKLPYATYQAKTASERPNVAAIAEELKQSIERKIQTRAHVLVVQSMNWAGTA
ncbi:hypothetical protein [Edaphobacter flagellatus]|uniref:hypothetical protein n=1 Tax=Edaphobacter flagellatus TaxID=1933044 RepID=UPI0021B3F580|nr:hypothetical protein [Edaphobacter flagellatus]